MQTVIVAPQSTPPRHGLVDSVVPVATVTVDPRWENGFMFTPENCANPETWAIPCLGPIEAGPGEEVTTQTPDKSTINVYPFRVQAEFECDTLYGRDPEPYILRARRILESGQSKAIESELATGLLMGTAEHGEGNGNLSLTDSTTFTTAPATTTATTPRLGLITLMQIAAATASGSRATIHATPATAMAWWQSGSLVERGDALFTAVSGHQVIAGPGYPGLGPDNVANSSDNEHWAYVTSPVQLVLGDIEANTTQIAQMLNRATNDVQAVVGRTVAAYWDGCLHSGVNIDTLAVLD